MSQLSRLVHQIYNSVVGAPAKVQATDAIALRTRSGGIIRMNQDAAGTLHMIMSHDGAPSMLDVSHTAAGHTSVSVIDDTMTTVAALDIAPNGAGILRFTKGDGTQVSFTTDELAAALGK